jgi:hypothetical protein
MAPYPAKRPAVATQTPDLHALIQTELIVSLSHRNTILAGVALQS